MNRKVKYIGITVVIVILLGGGYGYYQYTRGNKDLEGAKPDFFVSSVTLMSAFSTDEAAANKQYLNKTISVRGAVVSVAKDSSQNTTIYLDAADPMGQVACQLDKTHQDQSVKIHPADTISIIGICTGYLSDVVMVRCSVE